jgi:hypothetical protein
MTDRPTGTGKESQLTLKVGIIISLVGAVVVGAANMAVNHERRITIIETQQENLSGTLTEMKATLCEIQKDIKQLSLSQQQVAHR